MNKYVVVSTQTGPTSGRTVLVSFASAPMWKSYEELRRQEEAIQNCYDKKTALYALKKYGTNGDEVVEAETIKKELEKYKTDFPNWQ